MPRGTRASKRKADELNGEDEPQVPAAKVQAVKKGTRASKVKSPKAKAVKEEAKTVPEQDNVAAAGVDCENGQPGASDRVPGLDDSNDVKNQVVANAEVKGDDMKEWKKIARNLKAEPIDSARAGYERLLRRFPFADHYWVQYADAEFTSKNYDRVEAILKRGLLSLLSVDFWLFYLKYLKEKLLGENSKASRDRGLEKDARKKVEEGYEYALKSIGYAFDAGLIWKDYIAFIRTAVCDSQYDVGNKALAIKGAFSRAIKTPVRNLEELYKGLEATGVVAPEVQQEYMKAKTLYDERLKRLNEVKIDYLPEPCANSEADASRLMKWRAVIDYEKKNPERVTEAELKQRVRYVYRRALSSLYFFPEMWYEYSLYELRTDDVVSAKTILEQALVAIPDSLLLNFAVADSHELQGRIDLARAVYGRMEKLHPSSIAFIQSMQFERRVSGIMGARAVFRRARQCNKCDSSIFTAAANIEFHCNKDPRVARNVYELGMKRFSSDISFVLHYIRFLEHLNNDNDLIEVYERVLTHLDVKVAFLIWERYREFFARFITGGGQLKRVVAIEKRMREAFPHRKTQLTGFTGIIHRYAYLGQYPALAADSAFYDRSKKLSFGPHARVFLDSNNTNSEGFGDPDDMMAASHRAIVPIGGPDVSKTPAIIRKLETYLPSSLGEDVKPLPVKFIVNKIEKFQLPPKSLFGVKKKRKLDVENNDMDAIDIFKKRRK
uniref:Suppressor of forked domain-containing protein n=1 Tax=Mucochytrium quahogii TaxID=96639 RepID=A0A7S2R7B3_9STRA|mmetsp:Transcript_13578/g.24293  ORF Transcript_13578/g.24293 Transcript_13578/m.24293 type:complete len:722 (-) Transcript_13578:34-2199(-)|eukprot:CAMPEP_0203761618 /NCGR_PEP_ID=MMETSP0098-20131031/14668_1 /ASSEMBLY_ACC=CAM_ASM_000208 /TAXON_ID=96639 /ORGANISM=" , Strain NY0313808BC1" /LENGTH=721 /DNA_ID=CAMNT_0050655689 /DNA_START=106 /DNA_END=2268 /DNA_ORIENTATION=-